jgi:hypothetical protein
MRKVILAAVGVVILVVAARYLARPIRHYWRNARMDFPAAAPPIVDLPTTLSAAVELPGLHMPLSEAWQTTAPATGEVVCRALDLDCVEQGMFPSFDVILCWRDGKLLLRQWLNQTSTFERFTYDENGKPIRKTIWLSAADEEGILFDLGSLESVPTLPDLEKGFKQTDTPNWWVKRDSFGEWQASVRRKESGELESVAWKEPWRDHGSVVISAHRQDDGQFYYVYEYHTNRWPRPKTLLFRTAYKPDGAAFEGFNLRTHIRPPPVFSGSFYQDKCSVTSANNNTLVNIRISLFIEYYLSDADGDGNPETLSKRPGRASRHPSWDYRSHGPDATDANSNGCFEKVRYVVGDVAITAFSTNDDGTYDRFRSYRGKPGQGQTIDPAELESFVEQERAGVN